MDRNREARRVPMTTAGNGLSRRRHRGGSFRDSPEDEGPVDLPEAARLRDRGGSTKRDRDRDIERERERDRERDRLNSRSKRRRGERLVMVHGNLNHGGDDDDESSEESVNDDEEYDDGGGGLVGPPSSLKMLPPSNASFASPLSNLHHHQRKNFQPPPAKLFRSSTSPAAPVTPMVSSWKEADEMIGVSIPRKARSACTKRPHESWTSSATGGGGGGGVLASGEQINRQISPAPTSPSSSCVSARKKMKPLPPKPSLSGKLSSPVVSVQDEIEIEIAEVLYGMMRMPLATTSKQESAAAGNDLAELEIEKRASSPISNSLPANSSSSNVFTIAPKRKKPRHVKYEEENNINLTARVNTVSSTIKSEAETPSSDQLKSSQFAAKENSSGLDPANPRPPTSSSAARESKALIESRSAEEKALSKIESSSGFRFNGDGAKSAQRVYLSFRNSLEKKFKIDLMAPPPVRDGEMECVDEEAKPKVTEVETEAKPLLKEVTSVLDPEERKKPRTVAEAESAARNCELKLDLDISDHAALGNKHQVQNQLQQQLLKTAQASPLPLQISMPGWPGGLPTMGYMAPTQGVVPTDTSSLTPAAMQPPPHLLFNQPRPKRCATHCYIARNIQSHQQFTKMNPFWPAAAGSAPLYGTKACNLSLMPPTELQGSVLGRNSNPVPDKDCQTTSKSSDTTQRNQILLQQALPTVAANNMMHGPTFIFPMGQQPHAAATVAAASVRTLNNGLTSSGATATSTSMNGSASATPAGAPTMSFSYPAMPGNETQYLAILQNNGYPFPVPAHVGAPPAYTGVSGQPIPFFSGSFYSSQMVQAPHLQPQTQQHQQQTGQMHQSHTPSNQNGSLSSGSSAAQKHQSNQQLRPPINQGNSQGFPPHKAHSQALSFQQRQQPRENANQHSETVGQDGPSTTDSRGSRSNGQNFGMTMPPTNLGLMSSAAPGGGAVGSSGGHGEKKLQQPVSKAGVESFQSQGYAMTFATFNGANTAPAMNMSSIAQNHPMFHNIPEAARQGYQMVVAAQTAQQKMMNYSAPLEDGKTGSAVASANTSEEQRKTGVKSNSVNGGQSIAFSNKQDLADASVSTVPSGSIVDSSSRLVNLGSALPQSSGSMQMSHQQQLQQHMQRNHSQQPYTTMYLHKQQRYATSVAASAARNKGPVASNSSGFPDHKVAASPTGATKFPNANSGFPQNLVQSSSNQVQSPQWKNNSPRTTNAAPAHSPSILSPSSSPAAASSPRSISQKQQSRPQQSQISFAANSKPMASGSPMQQVQGGPNNRVPSPPVLVGSPSTSSISRNASGSPRTPAPASASSTVNKAGQASSTNHYSLQPSKNLQSASVGSSTGGKNNSPVPGNQTTSSGSKSQQQQPKHGLQQQAQLYFSKSYMQYQQQQQQQEQQRQQQLITISPSGGYYIQRDQQQGSTAATAAVTLSGCTTGAVTVTTTSDPAKTLAAAATVNNMKGGGKTQQHQLVPPGFPYAHAAVSSAVQVKPVDQKQQAGE
ncbi:unnamed protein product [Cochlearia groenlandica]